MLKWLQNRQLGHTVNKKTIRDQLAIHLWPKFKYRGVINDPNDDEMRYAYIRGLDWTSDGHYLISLGFCKLVSKNWTYMVSMSHMMAFGMLLMIGRVILDKTQL